MRPHQVALRRLEEHLGAVVEGELHERRHSAVLQKWRRPPLPLGPGWREIRPPPLSSGDRLSPTASISASFKAVRRLQIEYYNAGFVTLSDVALEPVDPQLRLS